MILLLIIKFLYKDGSANILGNFNVNDNFIVNYENGNTTIEGTIYLKKF